MFFFFFCFTSPKSSHDPDGRLYVPDPLPLHTEELMCCGVVSLCQAADADCVIPPSRPSLTNSLFYDFTQQALGAGRLHSLPGPGRKSEARSAVWVFTCLEWMWRAVGRFWAVASLAISVLIGWSWRRAAAAERALGIFVKVCNSTWNLFEKLHIHWDTHSA